MPLPGVDEGTHWSYGGHWGEKSHDAQFCINGLFWPDRTPHPSAWEAKKVQEPVTVSGVRCKLALGGDASTPALLEVSWDFTTRYDFLPPVVKRRLPGHLTYDAWVECEGIKVPLDQTRDSVFPLSEAQARAVAGGAGLTLTVVVCLAEATAWAPQGHQVAFAQHALDPATEDRDRWKARFSPTPRTGTALAGKTDCDHDPEKETLLVRNSVFECLYSTRDGSLVWIQPKGSRKIPLSSPDPPTRSSSSSSSSNPCVNLFRAPTDNDNGCTMTVFDPTAVLWFMRLGVKVIHC